MTAELATLTHDGAVATLALNRPESRNALSLDLIEALRARVRELSAAKETTVCVMTGEGKAFCAGMDLRAVIDDPEAPGQLLRAIAELTIELRALPMVTLAKVNGAAIGGGCGLVCVCDLAMTHADAKLGYPEVSMGVCPAVVAPWLVRKIGAGPARRMLLMGGVLSGREALDEGLVSGVVESRNELDAATGEVVERLRNAGPNAIRATKNWVNEMESGGLAAQVRRGAMISTEVISHPDARDALKRVFEGRSG